MTKQRHDRLLAALIAKLPPAAAPWQREERIAWLRIMAMAFDVVYGSCSVVPIAPGEPEASIHSGDDAAKGGAGRIAGAGNGAANAGDGPAVAPPSATLAAPVALSLRSGPQPATSRFHVDHDGFAMGEGKPIAMEDLPQGAVLWDERSGVECGDLTTILWRDIGTTRRSLPPGVMLKAATEAG